MKTFAIAVLFAMTATASLANVGPAFLPDLNFPTPAPTADISTKGCTAPATCLN